jgi:hypothetical protein
MSEAVAIGVSAWAYGPQGRDAVRDRLHPVWVVFGVGMAVAVAGVLGFVAFVTFAGSRDAVPTAPSLQTRVGSDGLAPALPAIEPLEITDVRLTDAVDAATGEPSNATHTFGIGEPVHLWLSFETGEATGSLTAVWFRGDKRVARLSAPLPGAASQMVFPLPEVAADQPGPYRVEVRSGGDVLAAESFEVTNA